MSILQPPTARGQARVRDVLDAFILTVPTGFDDERLWQLEAEPENAPTPDEYAPQRNRRTAPEVCCG